MRQTLVLDIGMESKVPSPISEKMLITKADIESLCKCLNPDTDSETCVENSLPDQSQEVMCRICPTYVDSCKCGTWLCCGVHGCIDCIQSIYRIGSLPTCPWCRFIFGLSKSTDIVSMFTNSNTFLQFGNDVRSYWKSLHLGTFFYVMLFSFFFSSLHDASKP